MKFWTDQDIEVGHNYGVKNIYYILYIYYIFPADRCGQSDISIFLHTYLPTYLLPCLLRPRKN